LRYDYASQGVADIRFPFPRRIGLTFLPAKIGVNWLK
jgi:hypothetical protein